MLLEEKFLEFHRYASSHNLPLEAISVGDENKEAQKNFKKFF